jgi:hypothetical protein
MDSAVLSKLSTLSLEVREALKDEAKQLLSRARLQQ